LNGKRHGLVIWWHKNGNKTTETPFVSGKVHGLKNWWYNNGNKRFETPFKNNIQHGSGIFFNY